MTRTGAEKIFGQRSSDPVCVENGCQALFLEDRIETLEAAMVKIQQWGEAYPLDVFPEPDMMKARELLKAGGITIDAVAASITRRAIERVVYIANQALAPPTAPGAR